MGWTGIHAYSRKEGEENIIYQLNNWKTVGGKIFRPKKISKVGTKELYALMEEEGGDYSFIVSFLMDFDKEKLEFFYKDIEVSRYESICPLNILKLFNPTDRRERNGKIASLKKLRNATSKRQRREMFSSWSLPMKLNGIMQ